MPLGEEDNLDEVTFPLRLKSFFESSKFSDLTIKANDRDFKVHRIVVCGQSEYFNRLFDHEWKETVDNVIKLEEDDPYAIEAMIRFMYGYSYDSSSNNNGRISPMVFSARVYRTADKYGVATLKQLSKDKFNQATRTCWDMDDFPQVITDVYDTSQCQELQETVAQVSHEHMEALLKKNNFLRALEETNGFAADLVQLTAKGRTTTEYRCPNCSGLWEAKLLPGTYYYCLSCGSRRMDWSTYAKPKASLSKNS